MTETSLETSDAGGDPLDERVAGFMRHLVACERSLFDYVLTLVGNFSDAEEVSQETKLRLWQQYDKYVPGTNFGAWAKSIAYYQVLDLRKRAKRAESQIPLELLEALANELKEQEEQLVSRKRALQLCLSKMIGADRDFVMFCYRGTESIKQIASSLGRTVDSTYQRLSRIRSRLFDCIESRLKSEDA